MSTPLPPEWTSVLDNIHASLNQAIQEVQASQEKQDEAVPPLPDFREILQLTLSTRQEGLADKLQALQAAAAEVEAQLAAGEAALRLQGEAAAALRPQVGSVGGRAIG